MNPTVRYSLLFLLLFITGFFALFASMIGTHDEFGFGQSATLAALIEIPILGLCYVWLAQTLYLKLTKRYPYTLSLFLLLQFCVVFYYRLFVKKLPWSPTFLTEFNTEHIHLAAHEHMTYPFYFTGIVFCSLWIFLAKRLYTKQSIHKSLRYDLMLCTLSMIAFSYHVFKFEF